LSKLSASYGNQAFDINSLWDNDAVRSIVLLTQVRCVWG